MGGACGSRNTAQVRENPKIINGSLRKKNYLIPHEDPLKEKSTKPPKTLTHYGIISDYISQTLTNENSAYDEILSKLKEGGG